MMHNGSHFEKTATPIIEQITDGTIAKNLSDDLS